MTRIGPVDIAAWGARQDMLARALADDAIPSHTAFHIMLKKVDWNDLTDQIPFDDTEAGLGVLGSILVGCVEP